MLVLFGRPSWVCTDEEGRSCNVEVYVMALVLYKHNLETYRCILEKFKSSNRVCFVQPTGTGKTFVYLNWIKDNPGRSVYVLAPSTEIFSQMKSYALGSGCPEILANVQFVTYQGLFRMSPEMRQKIRASMLILDEFHRIGAEQWGDCVLQLLRANNRAFVLGGTATPVRYLDNGRDMIQELFNGVCARYMTLGEAVHTGVLPEPVYVPVWYDVSGLLPQIEAKLLGISSVELSTQARSLYDKLKRNLQNSYGAADVFSRVLTEDTGKFVVFCKSVSHIHEMRPIVESWFTSVSNAIHSYISDSYSDLGNRQLRAFREDISGHTIKLLFVVDRFNEGLHLRDIDGVLMLRPTESPIIYLQQLGRALGSGGRKPLVFDFVNNYFNVSIHLSGSNAWVNPFEYEIRESSELDQSFRLFGEMLEFCSVLAELESLLFLDYHWEDQFNIVREFISVFSRFPQFGDVYKGLDVGKWCRYQRRMYTVGSLSVSRYEKLVSIGFIFDVHDADWAVKFDQLCNFLRENNRWPVQSDVYAGWNIGNWFSTVCRKVDAGKYSQWRLDKLREIGFFNRKRRLAWTSDDDDILKLYYPLEGGWVYKRLPGRTAEQCRDRAKRLGIVCNRSLSPPWTPEEDVILTLWYPVEGQGSFSRLSNRTATACAGRVKFLGIARDLSTKGVGKSNKRWSSEEDDILRTFYPIEGQASFSRLSGRSYSACVRRVCMLNLKHMRCC